MMTTILRSLSLLVVLALAGTPMLAAAAAKKHEDASPAQKTPSVKEAQNDLETGPSGKVVETMNSGGYTYVCLEKNGRKTWVAVAEIPVTVGATMAFHPGEVMKDFTSKSLGRTFETIVFSSGPVDAASALPAGHPGTPATGTGSKAQVGAKDAAIKVEKAKGSNAYTVSEVYAKRSALNKKKVQVQGKVVKVSLGIMGRNWVHLQDGTGDPMVGSHNLVFTTQDAPAVGDIVTASGIVAKDRDFGAGYLYSVIVEEAKIGK